MLFRPRHRELAMPGPATMRGMQVVGGKSLAVACLAASLALASEPQPAAPLPAPPGEGASGPYQERTRGSALRTRSIGLLIGTAWQDGSASASAEFHCT